MKSPEPSDLDILYEDNHCIAVAKPAGLSSTHFDGRHQTLDQLVKAYLKQKYAKSGNVFLGIVHRLDKPTSGVILFARTSKAAARLSEQFRNSAIEKTYWAVIEGDITPTAGTLEDWLQKNAATNLIETAPQQQPGAKRARTHYQVRAVCDGLTWLELRPQTGRKHQLRVQLASRRHPVIGDFQYGSEIVFPGGIALHARSLTFLHPIQKTPVTIVSPLPRRWLGRFPKLLREVAHE